MFWSDGDRREYLRLLREEGARFGVTFPDSKTVSYVYDKAGQRTRMIDPASNVVTYLYDDRGYLTKVSVGGSTHGTYYHDDLGRRTRLLYGNSSYASYLYDDANHLTLISNKKSDNNVISSFAYTVDDTGNRTKLTLSNGDYADYAYDDTYQLTREHRQDSGDSTLYYNNFYYDPAGNRTRLEYNDGGGTTTTTYLYNPADQLTRDTVGETNTDYLYDANGSLTKKDDGANVHSYAYDYRNLMTDYDGPGTSNDATYTYNAGGCRITKDVDGSKTAYFHDRLNVVAEYNGSNQLQRTYVTPGLDSNLTMTASGSTYYYLTDGLGSVRQLIDSNEATENAYDYEAFGKVYGTPTENLAQPFRFTGRAWDPETELYYYRMRNYASGAGAFLSRDAIYPLWVPRAYGYVMNLPTLLVDPLGLREMNIYEKWNAIQASHLADALYDSHHAAKLREAVKQGTLEAHDWPRDSSDRGEAETGGDTIWLDDNVLSSGQGVVFPNWTDRFWNANDSADIEDLVNLLDQYVHEFPHTQQSWLKNAGRQGAGAVFGAGFGFFGLTSHVGVIREVEAYNYELEMLNAWRGNAQWAAQSLCIDLDKLLEAIDDARDRALKLRDEYKRGFWFREH